jgi:hypothetical protein
MSSNNISALKYLHDAQRVIVNLRKFEKLDALDYQVFVYIMSFLTLWKMSELDEAKNYI